MKKTAIIFTILFISFFLNAQNYYYDDISSLEYLYLEVGRGLPFKSFPWPEDEVVDYLDRIEPSDLSDTGKSFYDLFSASLDREYLYSEPEGFKFDTGFEVVLEGFYHQNLNNNSDLSDRDYVWQYGYEERHPLLRIPLEADILDILHVQTEITFKEEYGTVYSPTEDTASENHFNLFDPESPDLDIHFPFQAVAALGKEHWTVQLGRDQLSWGNGQTGNLVLSDYSDFYDYFLVSTWWKNFKFSTVYIVMDEFSPRDDEGGDDGESDGEPDNLGYSAFIGHRFDMRFFNRLNVALTEAVTYTGDPFLVHDMNSMMAYHNWTIPEKSNSIISLEFEYIPWKYFYFYGQLAMDEYATDYEEEGDGGGGLPTWAWLAGVKGAYPLGPGYCYANFEWVHTDPLLYHRDSAPYFYNVRRIWSVVSDSYEYIVKPIGHEAGPDAILWHIETGYDMPPRLKARLGFDILIQGETTIYSDYVKTEDLTTPTGTAETVYLLNLGLESELTQRITAGLDFYYIHTSNYNHIENQTSDDVEIASYVKCTF